MKYPKTLTQFLLHHLAGHPERPAILAILSDLSAIAKMIQAKTRRAGLVDILGSTGESNIQAEDVQKLDVFANQLCKDYLSQTGHFASLASEEDAGVVDLGALGRDASFIIAFDPLDGSSNIDVNVSVGTIFSIHRRRNDLDRLADEQFFQSGREQVLAGYVVYGTSTQLIFTAGLGVHEFTYDHDLGEFFLSRESMRIPAACTYYSMNERYAESMSLQDREYVAWLKQVHKPKQRYVGSLVADVHRDLITGGVYLYPAIDEEGGTRYKPKLRLNFEGKPMAWVVEQAGGMAIDGEREILDLVPTSLHQRHALIIGNKEVVQHRLTLN